MPPKQKSDASAGTAKKRKTITLEDKVEIIKRSESGEKSSSICKAYDVIELLDSHGKELTNEDLMELDEQIEFREETQGLETPQTKKFSTKALANAFDLIEAGMANLEEQDSDTERFAKVYRAVTEGLKCYKTIYEEKKKSSVQTSLDAYFTKLTPAAKSSSALHLDVGDTVAAQSSPTCHPLPR